MNNEMFVYAQGAAEGREPLLQRGRYCVALKRSRRSAVSKGSVKLGESGTGVLVCCDDFKQQLPYMPCLPLVQTCMSAISLVGLVMTIKATGFQKEHAICTSCQSVACQNDCKALNVD